MHNVAYGRSKIHILLKSHNANHPDDPIDPDYYTKQFLIATNHVDNNARFKRAAIREKTSCSKLLKRTHSRTHSNSDEEDVNLEAESENESDGEPKKKYLKTERGKVKTTKIVT